VPDDPALGPLPTPFSTTPLTKAERAAERFKAYESAFDKLPDQASVQCISEISPIPNTSWIELAMINGIPAVVEKDAYEPGDRIVFIKAGNRVPNRPEFRFLSARSYIVKKMDICGQVTMGVVVPLTVLPKADREVAVGADVAGILGIESHESR